MLASDVLKSCPPGFAPTIASNVAGEPQPRLTARVTVRSIDAIRSAFARVAVAAARTCRWSAISG